MWRRIARALEPARLDLAEFRPISGRRQHRARLIATITEITSVLSTAKLIARLEAGKVVASPLLNVAQAADHPQLAAIGGVEEIRIDNVPVKVVTAPFKMGATPPSIRHAPPGLAADTNEVLAELGYKSDELVSLRRAGAFGGAVVEAAKSDS
jgi:crotonobetainyl-CoA:carnitine CoA-transferase CaiB-like acyl-CoA transferase